MIWRVDTSRKEQEIAGVSLGTRTHRLIRTINHVGFIELGLDDDINPVSIPEHEHFVWIEGAFPFLNTSLIERLVASQSYVLAPGSPGFGIRAQKRKLDLAVDGQWFKAPVDKSKAMDIDPIWVQCLHDGDSFGRLNAFAYEIKRQKLGDSGVQMIAPETVFADEDVVVEPNVKLDIGVRLMGSTHIQSGSTIGPGSVIKDSVIGVDCTIRAYCVIDQSTLAPRVAVGPFAHLRPETHLEHDVRIGNFVETKKAVMGPGSKASHLSYIGDAEIGSDCNIGAGTITCNYDGFNKNKTVLGDRVFIGSDSQLVAPIQLGDDAYVAAGTTVTKNVEPGSLAIARTRQTNKAGWSKLIKERAQARKS